MNTPHENSSLEEIQRFFAGDRFATEVTGCNCIEARKGYAVCELAILDHHRNAMGGVMGGAIFTLADFALAVSCNVGELPTVSVESDIKFLASTKGSKLIAVAEADKSGRHLGFYTVKISDDLGKDIALMTATCYR